MPRQDPENLELRCPQSNCGAALVRDECGIFCRACGFESVTWADPVDADLPMNVVVRRERGRRRASISAIAALVLAAAGIGAWALQGGSDSTEATPDPSQISVSEVRDAMATSEWPTDWNLPSFYRDPELFLLKRERSAQSVMVAWWSQRNRQEKLNLLDFAKDSASVYALPFVFEIVWFTSAQETDFRVARSQLDALFACGEAYVEVARLVCDHMATTSPVLEVRVDANRYVADLDERRRRHGQ